MHSSAIERSHVREFAHNWINAWNSGDREKIADCYHDSCQLESTKVVTRMGVPTGRISGKAELRRYIEAVLHENTHYELLDILTGLESVIVTYRKASGQLVAEVVYLTNIMKIQKSIVHFGCPHIRNADEGSTPSLRP